LDNSDTKPYVSSFTFLGDDNGSTMAAQNDSRQSDEGSPRTQFDSKLEELQKARNHEFQSIKRT